MEHSFYIMFYEHQITSTLFKDCGFNSNITLLISTFIFHPKHDSITISHLCRSLARPLAFSPYKKTITSMYNESKILAISKNLNEMLWKRWRQNRLSRKPNKKYKNLHIGNE